MTERRRTSIERASSVTVLTVTLPLLVLAQEAKTEGHCKLCKVGGGQEQQKKEDRNDDETTTTTTTTDRPTTIYRHLLVKIVHKIQTNIANNPTTQVPKNSVSSSSISIRNQSRKQTSSQPTVSVTMTMTVNGDNSSTKLNGSTTNGGTTNNGNGLTVNTRKSVVGLVPVVKDCKSKWHHD